MRTFSPRDAILVLVGAAAMHIFSMLFSPSEHNSPIVVNNHLLSQPQHAHLNFPAAEVARPNQDSSNRGVAVSPRPVEHEAPTHPLLSPPPNLLTGNSIPETILLSHAPGWTTFRNLYMSNGTLYIVTSQRETFPDIVLMTSTGLPAFNTPESIAERMPTEKDITFLTPAAARKLWIGEEALGERNRVFKVEGRTLLFNDPNQFLNHYYHFVAELFFGIWAFWTGTFRAFSPTLFPAGASPLSQSNPPPPLPANARLLPGEVEPVPSFDRAIFAHASGEEWRDSPGFNSYFLRAAFPSLALENRQDWQDRIAATYSAPSTAAPGKRTGKSKAWWFDTVMLVDRSAAHRGEECGARTQRTASEAMLVVNRTLDKAWWEPVRRAVLRFAGVPQSTIALGQPAPASELDPDHVILGKGLQTQNDPKWQDGEGWNGQIVVTYINRQSVRRHLVEEDHDELVAALEEVCSRRGWELNIVKAERLSKEEQLAVVARTTFLIGVHGNGLTHLVLMPVTPITTVIELFYPTGFAHDYEWTARQLGIKHYAVWNDTSMTYPDPKITWPSYPEGFQGTQIPVYGPHVAKIIEERADSYRP